jgi:hypothetical protein
MAERERDADGTPVPHAALLQVGVGRLADPLTSPDLSGQRDCETEAEEIVKDSRIVVTNEEENDGGEMGAESLCRYTLVSGRCGLVIMAVPAGFRGLLA